MIILSIMQDCIKGLVSAFSLHNTSVLAAKPSKILLPEYVCTSVSIKGMSVLYWLTSELLSVYVIYVSVKSVK